MYCVNKSWRFREVEYLHVEEFPLGKPFHTLVVCLSHLNSLTVRSSPDPPGKGKMSFKSFSNASRLMTRFEWDWEKLRMNPGTPECSSLYQTVGFSSVPLHLHHTQPKYGLIVCMSITTHVDNRLHHSYYLEPITKKQLIWKKILAEYARYWDPSTVW